jgi:hypothetical protein
MMSETKSFCASAENGLRHFRQDSNAAVMYLKSFLPHFSNTDEAGSRVLMSNPHEVWLAQLVTRDRTSWRDSDDSYFKLQQTPPAPLFHMERTNITRHPENRSLL